VRPSGQARRAGTESQGTPAPRDRLQRSEAGQPQPPESGAMRTLARALVDLAITIGREDEEDEPWTR
jgi:hypothetical protein